jgi:hypothetical protein
MSTGRAVRFACLAAERFLHEDPMLCASGQLLLPLTSEVEMDRGMNVHLNALLRSHRHRVSDSA